MRRYLLDTNIWIGLARNEHALVDRLARLAPEQILVCSVVRAELMFGARKSERVETNFHGFRQLLQPFESVPFDDAASEHYALIRASLERAGTPIGANDMMIASIALARDLVLVTRNQREFIRVVGIRTEVW